MRYFYLHGFLSGPNAVKAHKMQDYIRRYRPDATFMAPDYPDLPEEARAYLEQYFEEFAEPEDVVVGSSMGGFFTAQLQRRFHYNAVLLNPCVHPQNYFEKLIGDYVNPLTGRAFTLKPEMLATLESYDRSIAVEPLKTRVYLKDGDEVLDYLKAVTFFKGCHIDIRGGGDHAMSDFENYLDAIIGRSPAPFRP